MNFNIFQQVACTIAFVTQVSAVVTSLQSASEQSYSQATSNHSHATSPSSSLHQPNTTAPTSQVLGISVSFSHITTSQKFESIHSGPSQTGTFDGTSTVTSVSDNDTVFSSLNGASIATKGSSSGSVLATNSFPFTTRTSNGNSLITSNPSIAISTPGSTSSTPQATFEVVAA